MLDKLKELGFREATKAGVSIGIDDMIIPKEKDQEIDDRPEADQAKSRSSIARASSPPANATTRSSTSGRTPPTRSPTSCSSTLEHNQGKQGIQPGLPHGGLRRARQPPAGPPARRCARPDGQALRRHHRDADSLELPRRPDRARVLHLHARRPQRSGRYRAQDRRLRLHDPQAGRRGAGRDHPRGGLRHHQRHLGRRRSTKAKTKSSISRPPRRPLLLRRHRRSGRPKKKARQGERGDRRNRRRGRSTSSASRRSRSARCSLAKASTASARTATAATSRPARSSSSAKPSASSPRSPSANPARSSRCVRSTSVARRRQAFKQPQIKAKFDGIVRYNDLRLVQARRRQQHRPEQERLGLHSSPTTAANSNATTSSSARSSPWPTAARSRRARPSCSGIRTTCRFSPRRPARSNSTTSSRA